MAENRLEKHAKSCDDFVVENLRNFATSGDHLYFISQFRYFLDVKDEHGDKQVGSLLLYSHQCNG